MYPQALDMVERKNSRCSNSTSISTFLLGFKTSSQFYKVDCQKWPSEVHNKQLHSFSGEEYSTMKNSGVRGWISPTRGLYPRG